MFTSERYSSKNTRVDTQNDGLENVQDLVSNISMLGIYVQLPAGGVIGFPGKPWDVATLTACFPLLSDARKTSHLSSAMMRHLQNHTRVC